MKMTKILFICLGNICRSPAAHAIMQKKIDDAGLSQDFQIDSAGTSNYHPGELPDPRMREQGTRLGYTLDSRARQITQADLENFDMIITMDESNYNNVKKLLSEERLAQLHRLSDFSDQYDFLEVPDPYFGDADGFSHVYDLLEDTCSGLLKTVH